MAQPTRRIGERSEGTHRVLVEERARFTEFLVAARRRAGCSLDEISLVTKVPVRHLDALEQGRVDDLPPGVYRRAIIRTYATSVGLDPTLVLDRFGQVFGAETAFSEWQIVPPPSRVRPAEARPSTAAGLAASPASPRRAGAVQTEPPRPADSDAHRRLIVGAAAAAVVLVAAGYLLVSPDASSSSSAGTTPPASETASGPGIPSTVMKTGGDVTLPGANGSVRHITDVTVPQPDEDAAPADPDDLAISDVPVESRLEITSNPPGARVTVDGIGWGVTPITVRHLPPGVKVIRVTRDGFLGQERTVRIGEDGTASARITLQPRN